MQHGNCRTVQLTALEVPVAVRVSGSGTTLLAHALEKAWERCRAPAETEAPVEIDAFLDDNPENVAQARNQGAVAATSREALMHELTPVITIQAITRQREALLMLHACAVADPDTGAAVALVGPSGIGKTTAALTLARSFGYVTDETVALRDDNSLVPYPKPLSLCPEVGEPDRCQGAHMVKDQVSPDVLGLQATPARAHLAAILLLARDPDGPDEPALEEVPTLHALAALAPQTSFLASRPKPLHRLADVLAGAGGLRRVRYRDADQLLPVVRDLLDGAR